MPVHVNDNGVWREPRLWLNNSNTWVMPEVWVNDNNVWRIVQSNASVSLSPPSQSVSSTGAFFQFNPTAAVVTGGTPTAYNWGFVSTGAGDWGITTNGGSTTSVFITGALEQINHTATLFCDVTVGGQVIRATATFFYFRTFGGGGGSDFL